MTIRTRDFYYKYFVLRAKQVLKVDNSNMVVIKWFWKQSLRLNLTRPYSEQVSQVL